MKSNLNPNDHYPILARKSKCHCEFCKPKINKAPQMNKWLPTPENINALPEYLRDYIHQLEATCDPAGLVRENMQLKDTNDGLQLMYRKAIDGCSDERMCALCFSGQGRCETLTPQPPTAEGQTKQGRAAEGAVSDEQLMRVIVNACDSLHITRVHELGGKTRTIMEDAGLLEIARAVLAIQPPSASPVAVPLIARSLAEWHEDDGPVLWWAWCGKQTGWAGEPAWIGTPNDSDWPGYHTHWTAHPALPDAGLNSQKLPEVSDEEAKAGRTKEMHKIIAQALHDNTVAMQAAWIEWRRGRGAEEAMEWIENTLMGPGHIPREDEPFANEPQAYFDKNKSNPFPECFCGRPSNSLWMGQGFCSEAHYQEGRLIDATSKATS